MRVGRCGVILHLCRVKNNDICEIAIFEPSTVFNFEYLCGIRTVQQATENAAAGDLELTADELKVIDDSYERYLANK